MKKTIFTIAIAAAGLLVASCGSKTASEANADSTAAESTQVAEEPAAPAPAPEEKPDTIKGPTTLDLAKFSVNVPEGWYVKKSNDYSCELDPLERPKVEGKGNFGWDVEIFVRKGSKVEYRAESYLKSHDGAKKMNPVTLDGMKFDYYFYDYKFGKSSLLLHQLPEKEGMIEVSVGGYAVEDAPVQEILKSFKLKKGE